MCALAPAPQREVCLDRARKGEADRWPFRDTRSQRKRRIPNWHSRVALAAQGGREIGHQPAMKPHVVVSWDVGAGAALRGARNHHPIRGGRRHVAECSL
ncbi:hypothetical protein ZWY2020_021749 [Hordeum vulgare]|nr:hypothetical protein ZWY2020_021749 [Hordeum vulgare]